MRYDPVIFEYLTVIMGLFYGKQFLLTENIH